MIRSTSTRRWSANQSLLRKTPPAGPSAMGRSRSARSPTTTTVFENPNDSPVDMWTMQAHRPQAHRTNNNRPEQNRNCVTYVVGQKCYLCRRLLSASHTPSNLEPFLAHGGVGLEVGGGAFEH